MTRLIRAMLALVFLALPSLASAQTIGGSVIFPAGYAPGVAICIKQSDGSCLPVSSTTPIPSTFVPRGVTSISTSGAVAVASTFQPALPASTARLGCTLQNTSTTPMLVYVGPVATALAGAALQIPPGGTFGCLSGGTVLTDTISVTSATAGASYVVVAQ